MTLSAPEILQRPAPQPGAPRFGTPRPERPSAPANPAFRGHRQRCARGPGPASASGPRPSGPARLAVRLPAAPASLGSCGPTPSAALTRFECRRRAPDARAPVGRAALAGGYSAPGVAASGHGVGEARQYGGKQVAKGRSPKNWHGGRHWHGGSKSATHRHGGSKSPSALLAAELCGWISTALFLRILAMETSSPHADASPSLGRSRFRVAGPAARISLSPGLNRDPHRQGNRAPRARLAGRLRRLGQAGLELAGRRRQLGLANLPGRFERGPEPG